MKKRLIKESKGIWLFSIFIFLFLASAFIIYGKSTVLMTMTNMILGALFVAIIESVFIAYEKLEKKYKLLGISLFFLIVLFESRFGYIDKWYVIVPVFIILSLYIFWLLEGFRNCVVISEMEPDLTKLIEKSKKVYKEYKTKIEEFNVEYCLTGRKSIKVKEELNWAKYEFDYKGYEMFCLHNVTYKYYINDLYNRERTLKEFNEKLIEKINAVESDFNLKQEQEMVKELSNQKNLPPNFDGSVEKLEKMHKCNHKKVNKLLRRKWK